MGCGAGRPKADLRRVVLAGGRVEADPAAHRPGRGAYVCGRPCAERAIARKGFQRSFRAAVGTSPDLLDSL